MGKKIKKAFSSVAKVATLGLSDSLLKEAPKPQVAAQQAGSVAPQAADTTNMEEDLRRRRNQAGPVQAGAAGSVKAPLGSPTVLGG